VKYCGTDNLVQTRIALDNYSSDYDEAVELAWSVRQVLIDFRGLLGGVVSVRAASLENEFELVEFDPGLYRVSQAWVFWHLE
jgi:hypothetical protein